MTNPVYWILHSIASYKALWQLVKNPFYWEKTTHGLTNVHVGHLLETPAEDKSTQGSSAGAIPHPVTEANSSLA
jgi:hypothetical protein